MTIISDEPKASDDYASSPCMMHEFMDDGSAVQILYIYIMEEPGGFCWQVRGHGLRDPIDTGTRRFASAEEARAAAQTALDKACRQHRQAGGAR